MNIVAATTRVVRWPITRGIASSDGLSIESRGAARGVWREREAVIVAVRGDRGETGIGEAAPLPGMSIDKLDDALAAVIALQARLPLAIETPAHATGIADRVTTAPSARFAIETALLAAIAQTARTSVAALWSNVPLGELSVAFVVDDEREAQQAIARGARCLKVKAANPEIVRRIARAAPSARLRVDANRRWPAADVWDYLASLADLPIDFVEEPCVDAIELLGERLPCRIALDETLATIDRGALDRALASPDLAALVLKPTLVGGFARSFDLAAAARAHGVAPIVSHALEGPIGFAACRELARAIATDLPVGLGPHSALDRFWSCA